MLKTKSPPWPAVHMYHEEYYRVKDVIEQYGRVILSDEPPPSDGMCCIFLENRAGSRDDSLEGEWTSQCVMCSSAYQSFNSYIYTPGNTWYIDKLLMLPFFDIGLF